MQQRARWVLSGCCFLICMFWTPLLQAQSDVQPLTHLSIGTMSLPPYGWVDGEGQKQGIIYEMSEEIGVRSKLPFTNQIYPFKRLLRMLRSGEIDLISSQAHQKALDAGDKLAIQFNINVVAATRKGSGIRTLAGFKDKFMVYHQVASYPQLKGLPREIQRVNSYRQALQILHVRPMVDGAVFSEPAYYYWMQDLGLTPADFGEVVMIERAKLQWIFVRKDMPAATRELLRQVVEKIYREGMYNRLLGKYKNNG